MRRRAAPPSRSRTCPWCEAALSPEDIECPGCGLPLSMAAIDVGGMPSGTSSTASVSPPAAPALVAGPFHPSGPRMLSARRRRARAVTWMLAIIAGLLLVSGAASLFSLKDPEATADGAARAALWRSWQRAAGVTPPPGATEAADIPGATASTGPDLVSVTTADGVWFGAARSTTGTCHVFGSRVDKRSLRFLGTLGPTEPCTGDQAQARLADKARD